MELKHTPGPWRANRGYILGADKYPIAAIGMLAALNKLVLMNAHIAKAQACYKLLLKKQ